MSIFNRSSVLENSNGSYEFSDIIALRLGWWNPEKEKSFSTKLWKFGSKKKNDLRMIEKIRLPLYCNIISQWKFFLCLLILWGWLRWYPDVVNIMENLLCDLEVIWQPILQDVTDISRYYPMSLFNQQWKVIGWTYVLCNQCIHCDRINRLFAFHAKHHINQVC